MCALGPSIKIIKRNTQDSRSRPFSCSVDVVMLKDVYGPVKPLRFQGKWFRFIRYRVHSNYKAIYQAGEELQPQRQQLSCGVNKVNLACCSGRLTGRTKGLPQLCITRIFRIVLCLFSHLNQNFSPSIHRIGFSHFRMDVFPSDTQR